jgi:hypothetical protein
LLLAAVAVVLVEAEAVGRVAAVHVLRDVAALAIPT